MKGILFVVDALVERVVLYLYACDQPIAFFSSCHQGTPHTIPPSPVKAAHKKHPPIDRRFRGFFDHVLFSNLPHLLRHSKSTVETLVHHASHTPYPSLTVNAKKVPRLAI